MEENLLSHSQCQESSRRLGPGIYIRDLKTNTDERGFLSEILRFDWYVVWDNIQQINISESNPGVVRAWHRHNLGQIDYVVVIKGTIEYMIKIENRNIKIILDSEKPQLLRVPGKFWHGYKVIKGPVRILYFLSELYDYSNPDEERMEYKDD